MLIDIVEIRKSPGHSFHFDLTEKINSLEIGNDEICFKQPLTISLEVKNAGNTLNFSGRIQGDSELTCSRCLEKYPFHLDAVFEEQFCQASDVTEIAEDGMNTDEIHVFEGNKIDLNDIINENVVLGIPMKLVCDENCLGLCTVCGTNLNKSSCGCVTKEVDPRLEALKKYFER